MVIVISVQSRALKHSNRYPHVCGPDTDLSGQAELLEGGGGVKKIYLSCCYFAHGVQNNTVRLKTPDEDKETGGLFVDHRVYARSCEARGYIGVSAGLGWLPPRLIPIIIKHTKLRDAQHITYRSVGLRFEILPMEYSHDFTTAP